MQSIRHVKRTDEGSKGIGMSREIRESAKGSVTSLKAYRESVNKANASKPSERPVLCRNCMTSMTKMGSEWFCERCGLQWRSG